MIKLLLKTLFIFLSLLTLTYEVSTQTPMPDFRINGSVSDLTSWKSLDLVNIM